MKTLEDFHQAGKDLFHKLHLATYPVGITYIKDVADIPEGVIRPSMFGKKMSLCQAYTQARRMGSHMAMTADDNFCTPATGGHMWADISMEDLIQSQVLQGWHKDREAEERRFMASAKHYEGRDTGDIQSYCGFVCSPLENALLIPHTVLVYCDGAQLTHIIHALAWEHKHVPVSSFEGFGESCIKGGLAPFLTGKPQVVIPGAGDRAFSGIQDHELGAGLPADLVFYVLENLFKTGGGMNLGLPIRSQVPLHIDESITPGFQFLRDKMDAKKG